MPVNIYGAGPNDEPMYWKRYMGRVNVNRTCGEMFGPVFEQYAVVSLGADEAIEAFEYRLSRDTNLLTALTRLDRHLLGNVVIFAKHHADSD